jgi:hypothetical protein
MKTMTRTTRQDQKHATGLMLVWAGVLLPPIICAIQMETNYVLVRQACAAQRNLTLYIVTAVAMIVTIFSGVVSAATWKRFGSLWPTDAVDTTTRVRFISVLGLMSSAISFLVILAQAIATFRFDPCQL